MRVASLTLKQPQKKKYAIEFMPEADEQIGALAARDRATLLDRVTGQLMFQPTVQTRNRKPLEETCDEDD